MVGHDGVLFELLSSYLLVTLRAPSKTPDEELKALQPPEQPQKTQPPQQNPNHPNTNF